MTSVVARNEIAKTYVTAFASGGAQKYIANLETTVRLLDWGHHQIPLTINNGENLRTFVCSPSVGYVDYVREELSRFPNKALVPVLGIIVNCVGAALTLADSNRIIHINNWMMSTNLPVGLDSDLAVQQTRALVSEFPEHVLAMRSLNWRHSPEIMQALESCGWILLPSRQVYLVDDLNKESLLRRDSKNDQKIWDASPFQYQELDEMNERDALRIAELYEMLYLQKYSDLNPSYTPEFIKLTHSARMIKYLVFRDHDGCIQSFGGFHQFEHYGTMPLMGYNTSMDQKIGLYRLACHAGSLYAAQRNLRLNMSSGAAKYKTTRGAKPELEFTAYYIRHLPLRRRLPFGILRFVADYIGIPLLRRYEL